MEKVESMCIGAEKIQLFPLADASVSVIADAIIMERHPWNIDEVFYFYKLAFKPMPEAAMLAYKEFRYNEPGLVMEAPPGYV